MVSGIPPAPAGFQMSFWTPRSLCSLAASPLGTISLEPFFFFPLCMCLYSSTGEKNPHPTTSSSFCDLHADC